MTGAAARIAVIVAARNAADTIGHAVSSALAQPETGEVIVVDDASTDDTAAAAASVDDGSGRLRVLRQTVNLGPAGARNLAIAESRSEHIAILDADDYMLPGRFAAMQAIDGWDIIADNIAFIDESVADAFDPATIPHLAPEPQAVSLAEFIAGNLSRPGEARGEMGFAKPLIRRAMLTRSGLGYDERLRLGEDYALYAGLIAAGARFMRIRTCGYVAIERRNSLSGNHRTEDLAALLDFDRRFAGDAGHDPCVRRELAIHTAQIEARLHHRRVLDRRKTDGRARALGWALRHPRRLPALLADLARDKLTATEPARQGVRYLF